MDNNLQNNDKNLNTSTNQVNINIQQISNDQFKYRSQSKKLTKNRSKSLQHYLINDSSQEQIDVNDIFILDEDSTTGNDTNLENQEYPQVDFYKEQIQESEDTQSNMYNNNNQKQKYKGQLTKQNINNLVKEQIKQQQLKKDKSNKNNIKKVQFNQDSPVDIQELEQRINQWLDIQNIIQTQPTQEQLYYQQKKTSIFQALYTESSADSPVKQNTPNNQYSAQAQQNTCSIQSKDSVTDNTGNQNTENLKNKSKRYSIDTTNTNNSLYSNNSNHFLLSTSTIFKKRNLKNIQANFCKFNSNENIQEKKTRRQSEQLNIEQDEKEKGEQHQIRCHKLGVLQIQKFSSFKNKNCNLENLTEQQEEYNRGKDDSSYIKIHKNKL